MKYPTLKEVENADIEQLCRWQRFLDSPGYSAVNEPDEEFQKVKNAENEIWLLIRERIKELKGITPEISKRIGWKK